MLCSCLRNMKTARRCTPLLACMVVKARKQLLKESFNTRVLEACVAHSIHIKQEPHMIAIFANNVTQKIAIKLFLPVILHIQHDGLRSRESTSFTHCSLPTKLRRSSRLPPLEGLQFLWVHRPMDVAIDPNRSCHNKYINRPIGVHFHNFTFV